MKVSIDVTPLAGGARTGVGQAVAHTFAALARRSGVELTPYALSWRARDARADLPEGTRFPPVPARLLLKAWSRADFPTLDRWIGHPEVLHATNYLAPPTHAAEVVTVHDCWFIRNPGAVSADVRAYEATLRRALARGAFVHAVSDHTAHEVEALLGVPAPRMGVVPWGVPPVVPPAVTPAEVRSIMARGPFVLALGALEARKNVARLVAAFAHIPDVQLVIAGPDGHASPAVIEAIDALPPIVRDRVVRIGAVTNTTAAALLSEASVLAYPSLDEGFGFPVLEAMQVGTPVAAANAGAIPEVAGDAALLFDPLNEDAIAAAITRALTDSDCRRDLIERGRARARAFTWDRTADGLIALYEKSRA